MATKLVKVPVEGIKAEEVLALWHTGRLYVKLNRKNVPLEKIKDNVRAYVDRLRPFVTAAFRDSIDELWDEILDDELYRPLIVPDARTRKERSLNKNGVMRLVGVLRSLQVYECMTDSEICATLEGHHKDCSYRGYLGKGVDDYMFGELKKLRNSFWNPRFDK